MAQASTKIEDLPDNKETSSSILQQLNDDISQSSEDDYQQDQQIQQQEIKSQSNTSSYLVWDELLKYSKDAIVVFALVFALSNSNVISVLSNLPYINAYPPHSLVYNIIVSLVIAILYIVIKYSSFIYFN